MKYEGMNFDIEQEDQTQTNSAKTQFAKVRMGGGNQLSSDW